MFNDDCKARFIRLLDQAPAPQIGDNSAMGTMFTRAYRYCEPMRRASETGWYIFSPVDMDLIFDGVSIFWRTNPQDGWQKLQSLKDLAFRDSFENVCPTTLKGTAPVTIGSSSEQGVIQLWSGYILQTPPGYSVLVRDPPNIPKLENFESYEGIIRSDKWFGPLLTNIRLTRTDVVISLRRQAPIFFVQMVRTEDCGRDIHKNFQIEDGITSLTKDDWAKYSEVMAKTTDPNREKGTYARAYRSKSKDKSS